MIVIKELNLQTWPDFEALFQKHKGARGGCWCVYHKMTMGEYIQSTRESRYQLHKELVEKGETQGILVYEDGIPIAWCQYGKAQTFYAFDRGRDYRKLAIPPELQPAWRITCVFTDKDRRKEGWSKAALRGAIESIARQGGGVVEAFPLDLPGAKAPPYTGSIAMYEELGFSRIAPIGKHNHLMRAQIASIQ